MKKTRLISCILCSVLLFSLAGCGDANATSSSAPASGAVEATDGGAGTANPLVELADWNALHDALGFPMAAPNFALDVKYFVLENDIAQITFSTRRGINYTLRGTKRTGNIDGVSGKIDSETDIVLLSADRTTTIREKLYRNDIHAYSWTWDGVNYSLVCIQNEENAKDFKMEFQELTTSEIARMCAEITANSASAKNAQEYAKATHKNRGERQRLVSYTPLRCEALDKNTLSPDMVLTDYSPNVILGDCMVDYSIAQAPELPPLTWLDALHEDDTSELLYLEMEAVSKNGETHIHKIYDFMQQAKNGNHYFVGKQSS